MEGSRFPVWPAVENVWEVALCSVGRYLIEILFIAGKWIVRVVWVGNSLIETLCDFHDENSSIFVFLAVVNVFELRNDHRDNCEHCDE